MAFAGPHDVRTTTPEGYHTTAVDDVVPYFRARGISAVIRLNKRYYNERRFMAAGIDHHDMYYLDGSNPPEPILQRFLATCEQTPGAIAVHWCVHEFTQAYTLSLKLTRIDSPCASCKAPFSIAFCAHCALCLSLTVLLSLAQAHF